MGAMAASADATASSMGEDSRVARWAGTFGIAGFAVFLIALPLYSIGPQPAARVDDSVAFAASVGAARWVVLLRASIADPLMMASFVVFLAGFRHLIREARPALEWMSTLVFGAGLVALTLVLIGDGLQAGAALVPTGAADPGAIAGLWVTSFVFHDAIGLIFAALLLASAGSATLASGVLPRWTGWFAIGAAVVNLLAAPSIFGGTDYTAFYSASGYVTVIAQGLLVLWFAIAGVSMFNIGRRRKAAPALDR